MQSKLAKFERIARRSYRHTDGKSELASIAHPFDERNISPQLPTVVRDLFDNGHYAQATFEAYKFVDKVVQKHARSRKSGYKLMMDAFGGDNPAIRLSPLADVSEQDEQKGFQFLFAGAVLAIRNPRGHEHSMLDDPDDCLDHLSLASLLLRRIWLAGYR